jgi:hypothetical protein
MRPPHAGDATLRPGWRFPAPRVARPGLRVPRLGLKGRLAAIAVVGMVASLAVVGVEKVIAPAPAPPATHAAGTAFLQTTTCADWQAASTERRMVIVRTLAVAATQPDPENPGATLAAGAAYGLFQRACSTPESRSTLLYETYNRAASFRSLAGGSTAISGGFGQH